MRVTRPILRSGFLESVCWRCQLLETTTTKTRPVRTFSNTTLSRATSAPVSSGFTPSLLRTKRTNSFFLSNGPVSFFLSSRQLGRYHGSDATIPSGAAVTQNATSASTSTTPPDAVHHNAHLPHRRRQEMRRAGVAATTPSSSLDPNDPPPDASSILSQHAASLPASSLRRTFSSLLALSKPRLTVLVVLTAMASYALYPVPAFLSPTAGLSNIDAPSLSPLTLLFLTTGTTLCSASANALNMLYEPATDAKMSRTRARPLVRKLVSTRAAVLFALAAAGTGVGALWTGVNPTVAGLGLANIVLYAGVYTPMKRLSWLNTWVGAIVGGIPPLMGWAAAAGESATGDGGWRELLFSFPPGWTALLWGNSSGEEQQTGPTNTTPSSVGGWLLAGLLFAWQFPHFMALSWGVREEYKNAGLKMLSWVNPARNARVALRYSIVFFPLCLGLCAAGVTEWSFAITSLPVNIWLTREAISFYRNWNGPTHAKAARGLFWASVWHLPVIMVLALAQKKGMWGRVWRSIMGEPEDEDEWEEDEE